MKNSCLSLLDRQICDCPLGPKNSLCNCGLVLVIQKRCLTLIGLPPDSLSSLESRRNEATTKERHKIRNDNSQPLHNRAAVTRNCDYNLRTQVLDQFEKVLPVVLMKENTERGCYFSDVSYLIIHSVQHTRNRDEQCWSERES